MSEKSEIKCWFDDENHGVAIILSNTGIIEYENELVPGVLLSIEATLELIKNLTTHLQEALNDD